MSRITRNKDICTAKKLKHIGKQRRNQKIGQTFPKVKLYLDEDVDINLAVRLGRYGYNVVTTLEVGNLGNSDEKQLEYATHNGRAILTHNRRDFRRLHRAWMLRAQHHCGVIVRDDDYIIIDARFEL